MEDKKAFNIDMDGDGGDEHKKLVDKFLTIKAEALQDFGTFS